MNIPLAFLSSTLSSTSIETRFRNIPLVLIRVFCLEMINNGKGNDTNVTPKRDSKRTSAEYIRAMTTPSAIHDNDVASPETPSPPYNVRRSSTSLGFLASPLHPRAEAVLSSNGLSSSHENAFIIPQSPSVKSRLLPPATPKSRNAEVFLSPSPKLKSPSIYKENGKPIREISNGLKARLNYALVKLQNGWVDKTLPELENELGNGKKHKNEDGDDVTPSEQGTQLKSSSYSNQYATDEGEAFQNESSAIDDMEEGNNGNSAHLAFLRALSSPKKKLKQETSATSPLQWTRQKKSEPAKRQKDAPSEVEAIETLMSLSSPQRPRGSNQEFSLPVPPIRPNFSGSVVSTSSSSSSLSKSAQKSDLTTISGIPSRPMAVPIMQKQPSESSSDSLDKSFFVKSSNQLHYDQQQTDIETDVECSENE